MKKKFTLYIEINKLNFIFYVTENDEQDNFKINYKLNSSIIGLTIIVFQI